MSHVSQLLESRRARTGRWVAAALIVCALHAGGLALALMQPDEEEAADSPAGALTVELAPLPAPKPVDSPDVAHGPEQQVAKLTPEASKPVVEKVEKDVPPVEPSPAPKPEVALPKPKPDEKEETKEEAREAAPAEAVPQQQDRDVPITTAPPRVEAPPAASSPPKGGLSPIVARLHASWKKAVSKHMQRFKRYPRAARGLRGSAIVRFVLDRSGRVTLAEIIKSSGSPILDQEALATVRRASPMPAPPSEVGEPYLEFKPIQFDYK
jgi:protein TonB